MSKRKKPKNDRSQLSDKLKLIASIITLIQSLITLASKLVDWLSK